MQKVLYYPPRERKKTSHPIFKKSDAYKKNVLGDGQCSTKENEPGLLEVTTHELPHSHPFGSLVFNCVNVVVT